MAYCKYCGNKINDYDSSHNCLKKGLLNINEDNSFVVSTLIGYASDSAILGGLLGGNIAGGIIGDLMDGDLFD